MVNLRDVSCDEDRCYPVIGDYIACRDAGQLHTAFSPTVTPLLHVAIQDAPSRSTPTSSCSRPHGVMVVG